MSIGNPNDNPLSFVVKVRDPKTKDFQPVYKLSEATAQTLGGVYLSDAIDDADSAAAKGVTAATPFAVQKVNANAENKIDKTTTFTIKTGDTTSVTGVFTEKTEDNGPKIDFDLSQIPASAITGTLPIGIIPPVALSTFVKVTNDSARLALDNTQVQIGDTVYVESTKKMYYVKDDTKLGSEDAFQIYVAGSAATAESLTNNSQPLTVGDSKLPVYFSNGVPTTVDSKFTDIYNWYTGGTLTNAASTWNAPTIKTSEVVGTAQLDLTAYLQGQGGSTAGGQLYINAISTDTNSPVATFSNGTTSSRAELYLTSGQVTTILTSGNYNTWAATKNHNHDTTYLKLSGGSVTGAITSSSTIAAKGLSSTSTLSATGATTLSSTLSVAGNTTLKGTNTISGTTNMSGQLNMTNNISFDLGSTATSGSTKAITMTGGTDYGKIYYRVDGSDLGRLVIEYGDDGDARLVFRGNNNSGSKVTETYMDVNGYWSGTAASANKINTNKGSATKPVYFQNGVPAECSSVDLNATSATKASKLSNTSAIGSATKPVYFTANGVPAECTSIDLKASSATKADSATNATNANFATNAANATTATKLATSAGNSGLPIYFSSGKPAACTPSSIQAGLLVYSHTDTTTKQTTYLNYSLGGTYNPVYFSNGIPKSCTGSTIFLQNSVPYIYV